MFNFVFKWGKNNRKKFQFEFKNGEVLRLKLYEHLKVG